MNILGISGLENAVSFKRRHWPGLDTRDLRISQGHDSAAALVCKGTIVAAAAEERFNGKKHTGDFPAGRNRWDLAAHGLAPGGISEIVHAFDYAPYRDFFLLDPVSPDQYHSVLSKEELLRQVKRSLPDFPLDRVHCVPHHLSHAASAYYTSGWDECLTVVLDAMGEAQSATVYKARGGRLSPLREFSINDSIGILYSLVTLHLGFAFNADEYKIMGLAPYGDPARFRPFFRQAVQMRPDGSLRIPILGLNRT